MVITDLSYRGTDEATSSFKPSHPCEFRICLSNGATNSLLYFGVSLLLAVDIAIAEDKRIVVFFHPRHQKLRSTVISLQVMNSFVEELVYENQRNILTRGGWSDSNLLPSDR